MNETDWLGKPYYSLNAYFKAVYGQKIYKISVNAGLSCPNRDGSLDDRGCIFCSAGGSGDFAVDIRNSLPFEHRATGASDSVYYKAYEGRQSKGRRVLDVTRQIERGMARFNKSVGEKFVIYFQAYTNTYGDIEYLRGIWEAALSDDKVVGISVATRPDCLDDEVISLFSELKDRYGKFIWVELGLQTIHDVTAEYIRRHYPLSVYDEAVEKLHDNNIPFIVHIILGLPGETRDMMLETVKYVNSGRPQGIKLQLLHVLKGTDLATEYLNNKFRVLDMDEYISLVIECLKHINKDIVIHRVTGDGPKALLIAPDWSGNKKMVLNALHKSMAMQGAVQGELAQQ